MSKLFCNKQHHGIALLFDYVPDGILYVLILP
jgi:hypothetical protein